MPDIVSVIGSERLAEHRIRLVLGIKSVVDGALAVRDTNWFVVECAYRNGEGRLLPQRVYERLLGLTEGYMRAALFDGIDERGVGVAMTFFTLERDHIEHAPHVTTAMLEAFQSACDSTVSSPPDPRAQWATADIGERIPHVLNTVTLLSLTFDRAEGPLATIMCQAVFERAGETRAYQFRCDDQTPFTWRFRQDVRAALSQILTVVEVQRLEDRVCSVGYVNGHWPLPPGGLILGTAAESLIASLSGSAPIILRATGDDRPQANYTFPPVSNGVGGYAVRPDYQQRIVQDSPMYTSRRTQWNTHIDGSIHDYSIAQGIPSSFGPVLTPTLVSRGQPPIVDAYIKLLRFEDVSANSVTFSVAWEGGEVAEVSKDLVNSHVWFIELQGEALVPTPEGDPRRLHIGPRSYPVIYESNRSYFIKREAMLDQPLTPHTDADDGPF